ncbi:MAG TPA: hypothetical protein VGD24_03115 [Gallionella sp.]
MKISNLLLLVSLVAFAGCASNPSKEEAAAEPQTKEAAKPAEAAGGIVGTPAKGSKFAKLKLGMSKSEVIAKIGKPDNEWRRPTGKSSIPFYFGDDRWVMEATYKKEGKLTFNYGGDQALTEIVVNKNEE